MDAPPAGVTQEASRTRFLHLPSAVLALIFIARRIQPSLSLVDHEAEYLCTDEYIVLHFELYLLSMIFYFITLFAADDIKQKTLCIPNVILLTQC